MASKEGRKRKIGVKRQPNGQPYRPPADPREVVTIARMRQFRISKEYARKQWAGYEIGRLALRGVFGTDSEAQMAIDAVEHYVMTAAAYLRLKSPQYPLPKAMDYLAGRGASLDSDPSDRQVKAIADQYQAIHVKLGKASGLDRMIFHEIAFHDRTCRTDQIQAVKNCIGALLGR